MSGVQETDLGQPPIIYPEGFIKAVAADSEGDAHESSGGSSASGTSSSNTSQTQLTNIRLSPTTKDVELQNYAGLEKERHPSSSSATGSLRSGKAAEQQPVEYYCGVGRCRPSWMQRLRDARFFTFLLCLNTFIEGALVSGEYFTTKCKSNTKNSLRKFLFDSKLYHNYLSLCPLFSSSAGLLY